MQKGGEAEPNNNTQNLIIEPFHHHNLVYQSQYSLIMSHARKFHEPGVGSRTGMQVAGDPYDLDAFFQAGRKALIGSHRSSIARSSISSIASRPSIANSKKSSITSARPSIISNVGGSSMLIEESSAPSPRSTLRKPVTRRQSTTYGTSSSFVYENEPQYDDDDYENRDPDATSTNINESKSTYLRSISSKRSKSVLSSPRSISDMSIESGSKSGFRSSIIRESTIEEDEEDVPIVSSSPMRPPPISETTYVSERSMQIQRSLSRLDTESPASVRMASEPPPMSSSPAALPLLSDVYDVEPEYVSDDVDSSSRRRSILSEKSSNVSVRISPVKPVKQKKAPKKRRKYLDDDDDDDDDDDGTYGAKKQIKTKTKIVDGVVIEKIPSSHHRKRAESQESEEGIRRGSRYRYKPLEYWRGERAKFGRLSLPKIREDADQSGSIGDSTIDADAFEDGVMAAPPPVAVLKEIIRIPRAEGEGTFSGLKLPKKKAVGEVKSTSRKASTPSAELDPTRPTRNVEDGWDKETETHAKVFDVFTESEIDKQIACTSDQLRPRMAVGCTFGFEKVFVVEDFMATGVLFLLVKGQKPLKNSKDNYYTFTVLEGCVEVQVHHSTFTIAPQGMFFVPRGNDYSIKNISKRVARLAFTQGKSIGGTTTSK
ncbi:hypothetical protein L7F22_009311 [Adiantum nelumboides]|nr:hypothetical protein [Adiantum nelumboides]